VADGDGEAANGSGARRPGIRPWDRPQLWRELAAGEISRADLARKYGVSRPVITAFASRWEPEIARVREHLDDEFAGLWIANKTNRIAALMDEYEHAMTGRNAGHHEWIKTRASILRAVAEELGQIPGRSTLAVTGTVTHKLIGIDLDEAFPPMPDEAGDEP